MSQSETSEQSGQSAQSTVRLYTEGSIAFMNTLMPLVSNHPDTKELLIGLGDLFIGFVEASGVETKEELSAFVSRIVDERVKRGGRLGAAGREPRASPMLAGLSIEAIRASHRCAEEAAPQLNTVIRGRQLDPLAIGLLGMRLIQNMAFAMGVKQEDFSALLHGLVDANVVAAADASGPLT